MSLPELGSVEDPTELRVKLQELTRLYKELYILLTDPDLSKDDVAFLLPHNRRKAVNLGVSFEDVATRLPQAMDNSFDVLIQNARAHNSA